MSGPDYRDNDPRGWGGDPSRGAALGRPTIADGEPDGPITLCRVRLDSQGYDPNGTYFGACIQGVLPLYWYADEGGNIDACLRAADADAARARVLEKYPGAEIRDGEDQRPTCWLEGCDEPANDWSDYCDDDHEREDREREERGEDDDD